ncbi:MAG: hypothetical protein QXX30_01625 [Candidatus Aenigmatarchaeota archaeon]
MIVKQEKLKKKVEEIILSKKGFIEEILERIFFNKNKTKKEEIYISLENVLYKLSLDTNDVNILIYFVEGKEEFLNNFKNSAYKIRPSKSVLNILNTYLPNDVVSNEAYMQIAVIDDGKEEEELIDGTIQPVKYLTLTLDLVCETKNSNGFIKSEVLFYNTYISEPQLL